MDEATDDLDRPLSKKIEKLVVNAAAVQWKELGRELDIHDNDLDIIAKDHANNGVKEMCRQVLRKWKDQKSNKVTVRLLVDDGLKPLKLNDAVNEITAQAKIEASQSMDSQSTPPATQNSHASDFAGEGCSSSSSGENESTKRRNLSPDPLDESTPPKKSRFPEEQTHGEETSTPNETEDDYGGVVAYADKECTAIKVSERSGYIHLISGICTAQYSNKQYFFFFLETAAKKYDEAVCFEPAKHAFLEKFCKSTLPVSLTNLTVNSNPRFKYDFTNENLILTEHLHIAEGYAPFAPTPPKMEFVNVDELKNNEKPSDIIRIVNVRVKVMKKLLPHKDKSMFIVADNPCSCIKLRIASSEASSIQKAETYNLHNVGCATFDGRKYLMHIKNRTSIEKATESLPFASSAENIPLTRHEGKIIGAFAKTFNTCRICDTRLYGPAGLDLEDCTRCKMSQHSDSQVSYSLIIETNDKKRHPLTLDQPELQEYFTDQSIESLSENEIKKHLLSIGKSMFICWENEIVEREKL